MAKGVSFEREISKKISLWFSNNKDEDIFWHSDSSGGRFTINRKNGKSGIITQSGDITYRKEEGKKLIEKYSFELKTGYARKTKTKEKERITNWDILDLLDSKQKEPLFIKFWNQTRKNSVETNKIPVLIFRRLNKTVLMCLTKEIFLKLNKNFKTSITVNVENDISVVIFSFREFLDIVDPLEFLNITENSSQ